MYRAVPAQVDLPAMEHEVLSMWDAEDVFAASVAQSKGRPTWVFYEGPPTANGNPGTHHVEARVFKDVFPRYRTMKGFHVPRQAGWDCHGLPVELAVEILKMTSFGVVAVCARVSRRWNAVAQDNILWKYLFFAQGYSVNEKYLVKSCNLL